MTVQRIGKYRVDRRIGGGGMGSVYQAHDPVLDRPVALKVISAAGDVTDDLRARFFLEAQACARLTHPNIVTVYDMGEADGHLFIVMELLQGEELRDLIARRAPLPLADRLALMIQVCAGLHYAHQRGIVHRDVKPGNILVQRTGTVKILDFGIARIETAGVPVTRTGALIGTLQYMAPERVRGRGDQRSDVFSVGAVLYELLTHRPAFEGEDALEILERLRTHDPPPPSALAAALPPELDTLVARALEKDPSRRLARLDELGSALEAIRQQVTPLHDLGTEPVSCTSPASHPPAPSLAWGGVGSAPAAPALEPLAQPAPATALHAVSRATDADPPPAAARRQPARPLWHIALLQRLSAATSSLQRAALVAAGAARDAAAALRRAAPAAAPPLGRRSIQIGALSVLALAGVAGLLAWWPAAPPADTPLEDLRRRVAVARASAAGADAATLAATTFTDAEHASAEAEQRLEARDRARALAALQRAEAGYRAAEREAGARRARTLEADARRQAAPIAAAPPPAALSPVAVAPTAAPAAAQAVPAPPAGPAPATPRPPTPVAAAPPDVGAPVRAALADYARAIETKDLILLRRIRPGLHDDDLHRWARSFEITQSRKVDLRVQHLEVGVDRAQASGRREDVVVFTSGQRLRTETRFVCTLVRGPQGWTILDLRETRDAGSSREGR